MTTASSVHAAARRDEALKSAARLAQLDGVIAISLYGSVTHGTSDAASDVDLKVYWRKLSRRVIESIELEGFERQRMVNADDEAEDSTKPCHQTFHGSAFELELWHVEAERFLGEIRDVSERHETSDGKQIAISLLLAEEPLHGSAWLRRIQAEAAHYPDGLRDAMMCEYLVLPPLGLLSIHGRRSLGGVFCAQLVCRTVENLCGVLLGLNRIHGSVLNTKLLNRWLGMMKIAPREFRSRIEGVFGRSPIESMQDLGSLVDDTRILLQEHGVAAPCLTAFASAADSTFVSANHTAPDLRQISSQAAQSLSNGPKILTAFLFGSIATGTCDFRSNINLGIVLEGDAVPMRIEPLPGFHPVLAEPYETSGARVHLHARHGLRMEYWCWPIHGVRQILRSAITEPELGPELKLVISHLACGTALAGSEVFQSLQSEAVRAAAAHYDRDLQHHLYFYPLRKWRDRILARGHTVYFWQLLLLAAENIIGLLLALNRRPGCASDARSLPAWAKCIELAPSEWAQRLCRIFVLPCADALEDMNCLIGETLQEVAASRPDAGAERVLESYRSA